MFFVNPIPNSRSLGLESYYLFLLFGWICFKSFHATSIFTSSLPISRRTLGEGDLVILDDSFETELWYWGSKVAMILSVDVWHPDLTDDQWRRLGPI